jgi:uncharacterized protein (DUF885 family)
MKNTLLIILLTTAIGCSNVSNESNKTSDFKQLTDDYLNTLWKLSPIYASYMGLSQYDSILSINTPENIEKSRVISDSLLSVLESYPAETLGNLDKIDLYMMKDFLNLYNWHSSTFKAYEWDPSETNIGNKVGLIMNRPDSLEIKLESLSSLLSKAPEYYKNSFENIKTATKEHLNLAISQNQGTINYLNSLIKTVEESEIDTTQKEILTDRIEQTKTAIGEYIDGLETISEKGVFKSARIGKDLFEQKFKYDINSEYTAHQIYQKALAEKSELHRQMIKISDTLWTDYLPEDSKPSDDLLMVKMLIDKISENHVAKDDLFIEIDRQIKELAAFVDEKDLLTQDPTKPLQVRETPEYMRGVAGASISAPGPFEKDGTTFYNVTPLDNYTEEQSESYLREYNDYILQILNIHEAIPGHYTQLVYSNKSKSLIKSILLNGAMIEGWANYTEIMMLEEGYNNSSEMWLMRNKWHLRGVTNTILDYSYHVLGLTKEEAMSLMMDGAFQEQTEAEEKWVRLTVSSVQLSSYFTGFTQIYALREELKVRKGDNFNLKKFHEEFLSYGSAPVKYIRAFMLEN